MSFRLWIGLWIGFILIILVAVDASALVCYITRFTEENFATLIAFIFIYKAIENVLSIGKRFPTMSARNLNLSHDCRCIPPDDTDPIGSILNSTQLIKDECLRRNGTLVGVGCTMSPPVPDVFLMNSQW
ncbi:electrogenic sodium bicarbonate cotransporter 1-like [Diaphorina citri]|uniref:Electrogenic sodium bicarbonate cotransporter 1-like n=1 Tax=Diaphorina citri TaxID=121845 RepID=A0A1S4EED6_DIACI|nr:electrogenic sodium bicarbonate cotransporter 1-like [Diaphorina citri]